MNEYKIVVFYISLVEKCKQCKLRTNGKFFTRSFHNAIERSVTKIGIIQGNKWYKKTGKLPFQAIYILVYCKLQPLKCINVMNVCFNGV